MLKTIFEKIDEINAQDPNIEEWNGVKYPKELIYGRRMTEMLNEYLPNPSEELQIAARGQHIRRWHIPRSDYPMDRSGYLKWRTMLKIYHGEVLSEMMREFGFPEDSIAKVVELVNKKKLKSDPENQWLEDVVCLVFLKYHFHDFVSKHAREKIIDIVQKTWGKMTKKGHEKALTLSYDATDLAIIQEALKEN